MCLYFTRFLRTRCQDRVCSLAEVVFLHFQRGFFRSTFFPGPSQKLMGFCLFLEISIFDLMITEQMYLHHCPRRRFLQVTSLGPFYMLKRFSKSIRDFLRIF